jgi:translation initiation factor IF-3
LETRINQRIKANEVRLVGLPANPANCTDGVYPLAKALEIANSLGQDLIEISPNSTPPVCKIMEFSKFQYEKKKKEKDNKKNQKTSQLKEIGLSPEIGEHDLATKARKGKEFLERGDKVKVVLLFKGRTIMFKDRGELTMAKFATLLEDVGTPEALPKMEGKRMSFIIRPKTTGK